MPTTSPEVAMLALKGLTDMDVGFAVLHAANRLEDGDISDVDVAVASDPADVIAEVRETWGKAGLSPVVVWPYDIGGTLTVFLANSDGTEGVQLDMLFDPAGIGKYGVTSEGLMASARKSPIPVVSESARLVYLWRKRTVKGHHPVLETLRSEASVVPADHLIEASMQLTGSATTAHCLLGVADESPSPGKHPIAQLERLTRRVLAPIGYWAHVSHRDVAEELARRLSGYLVVSKASPVPPRPGQPWWHLSRVWPTTLRPGIFISHGKEPEWCPSPRIVLRDMNLDEVAPQLIVAMSSRITG